MSKQYLEEILNLLIKQKQPPEVFFKKGAFKYFGKFTWKHLCRVLFFNKVAGGACNFIKKEAVAQLFSCEFCEICKNLFFTEHPWMTASYQTRLKILTGIITGSWNSFMSSSRRRYFDTQNFNYLHYLFNAMGDSKQHNTKLSIKLR